MSDSSLSSGGAPTDATLEQALRNAVQQVYKSGHLEDLTVRRIRKAAEIDLDLQDGFFKDDHTWNKKSKNVIQSEVDAHPGANSSSQQAPSSPPTKKIPHPQPPSKSQDQNRKAKRALNEPGGPKKRRKKSYDSEDQDSASDIGGSSRQRPTPGLNRLDPSTGNTPPAKEEDKEVPIGLHGTSKSNGTSKEHSESELSELLDEKPNTKGRRRKSGSAKPKGKTEVPKAKRNAEQSADPNADEIKRLQGWLVKCGIRKVWGKELAPYDTSKAKIRHLKDMLAEAGMTGRFSVEKANHIKEERELRADLEAVQEGNKHWGKSASEDEIGSTGRPKRKLARGLEGLDFLNDDDGEETD